MNDTVFGPDGVASAAGRARLLVDNSTNHPRISRNMADRLREASGMRWLDVPVSGGPVGTRAGTLAAMVGGDAADLEFAEPAIASYARQVGHEGRPDPAWHGSLHILFKDMGIVHDLGRATGRVTPVFDRVESFYRIIDGSA